MKFLKKIFFKEVQDELTQLRTKIVVMNDKHSLFNKSVTIDCSTFSKDKNNVIDDIYYHLTQHINSDYTGREKRSCLIVDKLDEASNIDIDLTHYKEGDYQSFTLKKIEYVLSTYKYLSILLMSRMQFTKDNQIDNVSSFYLKRLHNLHCRCETILSKYSEEFLIRIDKDITDGENLLVADILKLAIFKESQILSSAISDADLLAEKNKIFNKELNVDYIYELVAVSSKSFELHLCRKNKTRPELIDDSDVFTVHNFINERKSHPDIDNLNMLSSIVINTKFFTESDS